AVIDFDELPVAVALRRPGDHAVRNREYLGPGLAGEVDAPVAGGLAGERVGPAAEVGGDPAALEGAALRAHAGDELLVEEHAFERAELRLVAVEPIAQAFHGGQHLGHRRTAGIGFLGTAERRLR